MIHEQSADAVLVAAGLGMLAGILLVEVVAPLGTYATALAVFGGLAISVGAGIWLLPHVETLAAQLDEHELLEGGGPT